jgi:hypothetical protein
MPETKSTALFGFCILLSGCAAAKVSVPAQLVSPAWTPQTPFPAAEGDLAYIRSYAATMRWTYTPEQERTALLSLFGWRAERRRFPGFVQVWGGEGQVHVNMKPPYDRQAMLALASPELRPQLIVHDVTHDMAEIVALRKQLEAMLANLKGSEWTMWHNYRTDRFDVQIVGEDKAAALRNMLPPELAQMTVITTAESPLVVF